MTREDILAIYNAGVIHVIQTLLQRIEHLEARVQGLESQGKKTPKTATNHLLPMNSIS
jgi:chaperonin cofactor prefoldin